MLPMHMHTVQYCQCSGCISTQVIAGIGRRLTYFSNEASAIEITACQQDIQAGEVAMQYVHAVQMSHAAGHLPGGCQNRHQVWEPMNSRSVCPEPSSVNPSLSACIMLLWKQQHALSGVRSQSFSSAQKCSSSTTQGV